LIKIDTEGAEHDILTSIPAESIKEVKWIIGELHGIAGMQKKDFEVLTYLSDYFEIDVRKTLHKPGFNFNACNKNIINEIDRREIRHLQY